MKPLMCCMHQYDADIRLDVFSEHALVSKEISITLIYIAHCRRKTSSALNTVILSEKQRLQWQPESVFSLFSKFVWKQIPDGWSSDRERPTAECCSSIARYIQLAMVCWAQSLTTSDVWDSDTTVCQVGYFGALLWRNRWTVMVSLYRTWSTTSSQCNSACSSSWMASLTWNLAASFIPADQSQRRTAWHMNGQLHYT